ncbi:carnitinyl-CoA dehydratase [Alphaproteobacteria bacterium]|nr:carnitinyl-CoA dehydratase [Alphaproteobacteria bacterium]
MSNPIKTKKEGHILEVTIDRPKANAIDSKTSIILGNIFAEFRDDENLRVAILTGAGEKFFSAGWDLKAVSEGEAADADYGVGGFGGLQELPNMNKPIIAAVNGIACGGGFEIMISTDIIVAAEHATFALPEINVGVVADAATIKLRRRIPYHVAVEFLMTGRWMDVKEAKQWGLVNEITNKKDLLKRAWEIADKISKGPNLIYSSIKEVLRETENEKEIPSFKILRSLETVKKVYGSEDLKEGASSFVKKTDPNWKHK